MKNALGYTFKVKDTRNEKNYIISVKNDDPSFAHDEICRQLNIPLVNSFLEPIEELTQEP